MDRSYTKIIIISIWFSQVSAFLKNHSVYSKSVNTYDFNQYNVVKTIDRIFTRVGDDPAVTFAGCKEPGWRCVVKLDVTSLSTGRIERKECNVDFDRESRNLRDGKTFELDLFELAAVNGDSAIVFTHVLNNPRDGYKRSYLYRILDMNTCNLTELEVPLHGANNHDPYINYVMLNGASVIPYLNGTQALFESFLPNFEGNRCIGAICKITFDANGKLIGNPVGYMSKEYIAQRIVVHPLRRTPYEAPPLYMAIIYPVDLTFVGSVIDANERAFTPEMRSFLKRAKPYVELAVMDADGRVGNISFTNNLKSWEQELESVELHQISTRYDTSNQRFSICQCAYEQISCSTLDWTSGLFYLTDPIRKDPFLKETTDFVIHNGNLLQLFGFFVKEKKTEPGVIIYIRTIEIQQSQEQEWILPVPECYNFYKYGSLKVYQISANTFAISMLCNNKSMVYTTNFQLF